MISFGKNKKVGAKMEVIYLSNETKKTWKTHFPILSEDTMYKLIEQNEVVLVDATTKYVKGTQLNFPTWNEYELKLNAVHEQILGVETLPLIPDDDGVIYTYKQ